MVMCLLHWLALVYLYNNITFSVQQVERVNNSIADTLSCLQKERFCRLVLEANPILDPFPKELWELGKMS